MPNPNRVGGEIFVTLSGTGRLRARGTFTCNTGHPKRSAVVGSGGVHGYSEEEQVPFIEGEITKKGIDIDALCQVDGETVTAELADGSVFVLQDAWFAGDGNVDTQDGKMQVRFEGLQADWDTPPDA